MLNQLGKFFGNAGHEPDQKTATDRSNDTGTWSTEKVAGRTVDFFAPAGHSTKPAGCVLFLHGHGGIGLTQNMAFTQLFQQHNLAAACPDGARCWWMDAKCEEFDAEMTSHEWLLDKLIPEIEQRFAVESPNIALLGVSMGGQGVLQLAYRHAMQFPIVAAISPAIDFHQLYGQGLPLDQMFKNVEDARQETVVLNLHPLSWPRHQWFCCDPTDTDWIDGAIRLGMKLSSSGILHKRDLDTSAGGHTWDYFNHMAPHAVQHIVEGLQPI